jgi:hypothetical protein
MKENACMSGSKRLNIKLDDCSFEKLQKIKDAHGDSTYTQAIKRAIAFLEFLDEQREEGLELYLGSEKEKDSPVMRVLVAP